jgi:hypothetical protein
MLMVGGGDLIVLVVMGLDRVEEKNRVRERVGRVMR